MASQSQKSSQQSPISDIEQVQALADILHLCYVVIATKPVQQLQICPIVYN